MPNLRKRITLGIDIGGTRIKSVILEHPDHLIEEHRIDSDAKFGPEAVRKAVRKAVHYYSDKGLTLSAIGLGCAGSVNQETGVVLNSPNFANWKDIPLADWARADFDLPVVVANDAKCAAVTEWKIGSAKGVKNAILLTFGTGVGGGLILNGQLFLGATGTAGELGHFSIYADGVMCPCGNQGCFERYCSASALEASLPNFTAKEIFARETEEPFKSTLKKFFHDLQIGVTSLANIFDPDCILIGGGLSSGIVAHLPMIQKWIEQHAFPMVAKRAKIIPTKFLNQSGAIGAALLAQDLLVSD